MRERDQVFRVGERKSGTERDENGGAVEDTGQSFRNGGRGKTRNAKRDGTKGREGCAQEKNREREKIPKGERNASKLEIVDEGRKIA